MSDVRKYAATEPAGKSYPIAETFYSLQGEGYWTGTPATFIRLAGCSVGCAWCDTDYRKREELAVRDLVAFALRQPTRHVVITGGEPTDHDLVPLVEALKGAGCFVQLETAGVREVAAPFDWVTVSPKGPASALRLRSGSELKLVFAWPAAWIPEYLELPFKHFFIQPLALASGNNATEAVAYVKAHPRWRLSLQTHKILGVP